MTSRAGHTYREGNRVAGLGREGTQWDPQPTGVITEVWKDRSGQRRVRVQWDDSIVNDDMDPTNLRLVDGSTRNNPGPEP